MIRLKTVLSTITLGLGLAAAPAMAGGYYSGGTSTHLHGSTLCNVASHVGGYSSYSYPSYSYTVPTTSYSYPSYGYSYSYPSYTYASPTYIKRPHGWRKHRRHHRRHHGWGH